MKVPFPVTFPDQAEFGLQKGPLPHPDAGYRRADNHAVLIYLDEQKRRRGGSPLRSPDETGNQGLHSTRWQANQESKQAASTKIRMGYRVDEYCPQG
jgi:hypothetical protein